MMEPRRLKTWLYLAVAALAGLLVGLLVYALAWPLPAAAPDAAASAPAPAGPASPAAAAEPPADAAIWARDLRKPIFDAPPAVAASAPRPPLKLKFVGAVIEPGFTYGIFTDGQGGTVLGKVGQKLEGAEIRTIEAAAASVWFEDELVTLKVQAGGG